jgi:hypothetical protein
MGNHLLAGMTVLLLAGCSVPMQPRHYVSRPPIPPVYVEPERVEPSVVYVEPPAAPRKRVPRLQIPPLSEPELAVVSRDPPARHMRRMPEGNDACGWWRLCNAPGWQYE